MLVPRYSVRWMLGITAGCAVLAFVVSLSVAGSIWATALAITIAATVAVFAMYAIAFFLAWGGVALWQRMTTGRGGSSPFAMHTPPPQWVPPEEPD